jgi:hypothetical protein
MTKLIGRAAVTLTILALWISSIDSAFGAPFRPFKIKGETTVTPEDMFGSGPTEGTGTGTHLGKFALIGEVTFRPVADTDPSGDEDGFDLAGVGTQTFVAANGDELFTTFSGVLDTETLTADVEFDIVGGTGRFEGATGEFVSHVVAEGTSFTFTGQGKIKY